MSASQYCIFKHSQKQLFGFKYYELTFNNFMYPDNSRISVFKYCQHALDSFRFLDIAHKRSKLFHSQILLIHTQ